MRARPWVVMILGVGLFLTAAATAPAAELGNSTVIPNYSEMSNSFWGTVFQATTTFSPDTFHIYISQCDSPVMLAMAVYAVDPSNRPTTLLWSAVSNGIFDDMWVTRAMSSPPLIVSGTKYFLCANPDSMSGYGASIGLGPAGVISWTQAISGSFPDPFGLANLAPDSYAIYLSGPDFTPTVSPSPVNTSTRTHTRTITRTATRTASPSVTRTATPTPSRTSTASPTRTPTVTRTATASPTFSPTHTRTQTLTRTPTPVYTRTASPTISATLTISATWSATPTATRTASRTCSPTPSPTRSPTATRSATRTATASATLTATRSATLTPTASATLTATRTVTLTRTITRTSTWTRTATVTETVTASHTRTATLTSTRTVTPGWTATPTSTPTLYVLAEDKVITYPSPAKGKTVWFYYWAEGPATVGIEIFNPAGERIAMVEDAKTTTGYCKTAWNISRVAPGPYLYRLTLTSGNTTRNLGLKRLVIVK